MTDKPDTHSPADLAVTETQTAHLRGPQRAQALPAADVRALLGKQLDRYILRDVVGMGGVGVVYAAYDPDLDRHVALKLLRGDRDISAHDRKRLLREARAMAKLSHPNVITVYEIRSAESHDFVVMELIEGVSLADWLDGVEIDGDRERMQVHESPGSQGEVAENARNVAALAHADAHGDTLPADAVPQPGSAGAAKAAASLMPPHRPWREVLDYFARAGLGLAAAHKAGLIHRDFKAANVLLGKDGRVIVTDFGLARLSDGRADMESAPAPASGANVALTQTGMLLGTPAYMAPEQFRGGPTDARTDQFNFCASLYHALYGVRPFAGNDVGELAVSVLAGRLRAAPAGSPVPRRLYQVLTRGLSSDPSGRYASMNELLDELARAAKRRVTPLVAAAAAAAVALAIGGAVVGLRADPSAPINFGPGARVLSASPEARGRRAEVRSELKALETARRQAELARSERERARVLAEARQEDGATSMEAKLLLAQKLLSADPDRASRLIDEIMTTMRAAAGSPGERPLPEHWLTQSAALLDAIGEHEEAAELRKLLALTQARDPAESGSGSEAGSPVVDAGSSE